MKQNMKIIVKVLKKLRYLLLNKNYTSQRLFDYGFGIINVSWFISPIELLAYRFVSKGKNRGNINNVGR